MHQLCGVHALLHCTRQQTLSPMPTRTYQQVYGAPSAPSCLLQLMAVLTATQSARRGRHLLHMLGQAVQPHPLVLPLKLRGRRPTNTDGTQCSHRYCAAVAAMRQPWASHSAAQHIHPHCHSRHTTVTTSGADAVAHAWHTPCPPRVGCPCLAPVPYTAPCYTNKSCTPAGAQRCSPHWAPPSTVVT
jgi:hypothetical protein